MSRENRAVSPSTSSTTSVRIASHIQLSPIVSDLKMYELVHDVAQNLP